MGSPETETKPDFILLRVAVRPEGAFGVLLQDGLPVCLTLERTYESPEGLQLTKIPTGRWPCRKTVYYAGGYETFEILVPGHERLLFHRGNLELESDGCVLLGRELGTLHGQPAVLRSLDAYLDFMRRTWNRDAFSLEVRQV